MPNCLKVLRGVGEASGTRWVKTKCYPRSQIYVLINLRAYTCHFLPASFGLFLPHPHVLGCTQSARFLPFPDFLMATDLLGPTELGLGVGKAEGRVLGAGAGGQGRDAEHCKFPSPMGI